MTLMTSALYFGLLAGFSPSPHNMRLLSLGLSEHSRKHGLRFILEALVLDLLWVGLIFSLAAQGQKLIDIRQPLSLLGGAFFIYLGCKLFMKRNSSRNEKIKINPSFGGEGILIQLFNPNALLFWTLIALPLFLKLSAQHELQDGLYFVVPFLTFVYGIKLLLFLGVNRLPVGLNQNLILRLLAVGYLYQGARFIYVSL